MCVCVCLFKVPLCAWCSRSTGVSGAAWFVSSIHSQAVGKLTPLPIAAVRKPNHTVKGVQKGTLSVSQKSQLPLLTILGNLPRSLWFSKASSFACLLQRDTDLLGRGNRMGIYMGVTMQPVRTTLVRLVHV